MTMQAVRPMVGMAPMIRMENVGKRFFDPRRRAEFTVFQGLSFDVAEGELLAIVGPSGCGKSTVLNMIAGFERPSEGVVLMDGTPVDGPSRERTMVFQSYVLFDWKTVADNIQFGLKGMGLPRPRRAEIVASYVALVGLQGFENRYPHELSGGMRQRVALARALAIEPKVVLLDEPLAAIDLQTREVLQDEVARICEKAGQTMVLVTHSVEEAIYLADRVIVFSRHPTRILDVVAVDLDRPRQPKLREAASFKALRDRIWGHLREQVIADMKQL